MKTIKSSDVSKSYNGKSGCMCGCIGTYTLPSDTNLVVANQSMGYEAYDDSSLSDRRINIAVKKINDALVQHADDMKDGEFRDGSLSVGMTDNFAWIDTGTRNTTVYF